MSALCRLALMFLCATGLWLENAQPCQAADWALTPITFSTQAWIDTDSLISAWSWGRNEEDRPSLGLAIFDCFMTPMSRLSVSLSHSAWTQIGLSSQVNLSERLWLNMDCGMVLGNSLSSLVSKTTAAMAGFTYYFD